MRGLSASELLEVWETGRSRSPLDRAILLLLLAFPEFSPESASTISLGQKDVLLLRLREQLFGEQLESVVSCPACQEMLEFSLTGGDLGIDDYPTPPDTIEITVDTYSLTLRLPTVADVRQAAGIGERLFSQIVIRATCDNEPIAVERLPGPVMAAAAERLQAIDPLADPRLVLACPACAHTWQAPLDVITFFWYEIDHWAQRMLYTVHLLASTYGWREQDILAMSAWRRNHYLEFLSE